MTTIFEEINDFGHFSLNWMKNIFIQIKHIYFYTLVIFFICGTLKILISEIRIMLSNLIYNLICNFIFHLPI